MESPAEGARLAAQAKASPSAQRLAWAGLCACQRVADIGCGSGAVAEEIADLVGPAGFVTLLDPSMARLHDARARLGGRPNVEFRQGSLPSTGLADSTYDVVWSQFVLQYLPDTRPAVEELVRITRRGGRVVVAEIDGAGAVWPAPPVVLEGMELFERGLRRHGFDLLVGRKLFHRFREAGLADIDIEVSPFNLVTGAASATLLEDWRQRFDTLAPAVGPEFADERSYRDFADAYLQVLANPEALKYSIMVTTRGTRP
ncbi:MAG: methyltransferase domain-containing protein [Myxococcaceae bacterium]|nr:methyltransferase domain-containing protein [Myxococcaceae bacterium]